MFFFPFFYVVIFLLTMCVCVCACVCVCVVCVCVCVCYFVAFDFLQQFDIPLAIVNVYVTVFFNL